jgi:hypothetical protein
MAGASCASSSPVRRHRNRRRPRSPKSESKAAKIIASSGHPKATLVEDAYESEEEEAEQEEEQDDLAAYELDDDGPAEEVVIDEETTSGEQRSSRTDTHHTLYDIDYEEPPISRESAESFNLQRETANDLDEFKADPSKCKGRDPVSRHSKPLPPRKSTLIDLLIAGINYIRAQHRDHNMTDRKETVDWYLKQASVKLVERLNQQSAESASIVLTAIAKGEFTEPWLFSKIKNLHQDDAVETSGPAIYGIFVFDKAGICRLAYIGMSTNGKVRAGDHWENINSVDEDYPIESGEDMYEVIRKAKKEGHTVLIRTLARIPKEGVDPLRSFHYLLTLRQLHDVKYCIAKDISIVQRPSARVEV